jgi:excisionase family DNA binding protein
MAIAPRPATRRPLPAPEPAGADPRVDQLLASGLISIREATRFCGLSRTSLWRAMDRGEIAFVRVSPRKRLLSRSAFKAWLARGLTTGPVSAAR